MIATTDTSNVVHPDAFAIAHLSDPHLTVPAGMGPTELTAKRVLGYLSWLKGRRRRHDRDRLERVLQDLGTRAQEHTIVSGDLTHLGLPDEHRQAAAWLTRLGPGTQVSVVAGNHERYGGDAPALTAWREYLEGDDGAGPPELDAYPMLRVRRHVAIVLVNTAVPTAPFLATGRVGKRQLERLADRLGDAGRAGRFRVVVMHHSPLEQGHPRRKRLVDAAAVTTVLRDCGAELVVHGHGHDSSFTTLAGAGGRTCVIGVPSASRTGDVQAGWNRYTIADAGASWSLGVEMRRYRVATDRFETVFSETLDLPRRA